MNYHWTIKARDKERGLRMEQTHFLIDGNTLDISGEDANTFKGFGYISCNNSSRLLLDYKYEHPETYQQILQILFGGKYPLLRMIKVEMGDDANTSSGTEPATKRSEDEEANVSRGAGFQIIADAKKIQPKLKTAILRWGEPGWLRPFWTQVKSEDPDNLVPETAYEPMYQWYKQTIIAAFQKYGFLIDYIDPDRNENVKPMLQWIKWFSQRIKHDTNHFPSDFPIEQYQQIKIVAADQNYETNFGDYMMKQDYLLELVDAVGYHYNTDDGAERPFTSLADQKHHEVWYSEGVAPMGNSKYRVRSSAGNSIGGPGSSLDVANRVIKGYFKSRRSLYLFQPAVAAYYPGVNYTHKELITAQRPWSGFFEVDNVALQVMKHFTDFAVTGWKENDAWRYLTSACYSGVGGTENLDFDTDQPSYLTLVSPDKKNFSIVCVNDSAKPRKYVVNIKNLYLDSAKLDLWTSCGPDNGKEYDSNLKKVVSTKLSSNGVLEFDVPAHGIATATTLKRQNDPEVTYERITSVQEDNVLGIGSQNETLYQDNFGYSSNYFEQRGGTPRYTTDQGGAFEVVPDSDGKFVLQQMITEKERALDWEYSFAPNFSLGDDQWSDYKVSITFKFDLDTKQNSADGNYFAIGLRSITDIKGRLQSAPYVFKLDTNGHYELIIKDKIVEYGFLNHFNQKALHTLTFGAADAELKAVLDQNRLVSYRDIDDPVYSGRIKVATGYYHTQITDVKVLQTSSKIYVKQRIDDSDPLISYTGKHEHEEGIRNSVWNRSLTLCSQDSGFNFKMDGIGFDLIGQQEESSRLLVIIDGQQRDGVYQPALGGERQANLRISGLAETQHDVSVRILSGKYVLDAVEVLGK